MKTVRLFVSIFLLAIAVGCVQPTQTADNAPQGKEALTQTQAQNQPQAQAPAQKSERGTPDEAKAMLEKAVEHYNAAGRQQALADFNARKAPFFDRDLYVACMGPDHVLVANGGFPNLVGTSSDAWRDSDGRSVGKASWDAASGSGSGSVEYRWYNPASGKLEPKILFVRKVGDDVCGVGAYNPK